MSSNTNTPSSSADAVAEQSDFVLKHRITGAAFLLFFGALFLPWLLGAPSDASKVKESVQNSSLQSAEGGVTNSMRDGDRSLNDELLSAIENEDIAAQTLGEEQVYISKITPLDAAKGAQLEAQKSPQSPANSPAKQEVIDVSEDKPIATKSLSEAAKPKSTEKPKNAVAKAAAPTVAKNTSVDKAQQDAALNNTLKDFKSKSGAADAAASKPVPKRPSVDVGWIVQVGVFTDKKGAARVVDDLKKKGFEPFTSIVDTNRGKATGTRIWLGPYSQRVAAAKAKTQLTSKTGEAGFIRAYP